MRAIIKCTRTGRFYSRTTKGEPSYTDKHSRALIFRSRAEVDTEMRGEGPWTLNAIPKIITDHDPIPPKPAVVREPRLVKRAA
jgi:hypothetical protein